MFPEVEFDNFEDGDLIYGLNATRDNYVNNFSRFSKALTQNDRLGSADYFIDFHLPYRDPGGIPNALRQSGFERSMLNHPKYKYIISRNKPWKYNNVMQKSKGGLNWAKEDNIRVHFLLEDIDMRGVVNKSRFNIERQGKVKPITGSELRWLYRNRHDEGVQKNVQFWNRGRRVDPPWVTDKPLWDTYHPTHPSGASAGESIAARTARSESEAEVAGHEAETFFELFADFF